MKREEIMQELQVLLDFYNEQSGAVPLCLAEAMVYINGMPRWIPVSEGLPSYGEDVLLSIGRYATVGYLVPVSDDDGGYNWFYSGWYHSLSDVDVWMPLPEPYKEG